MILYSLRRDPDFMKSARKKKVPLQVYLPEDLYRELREMAESYGLSTSSLVREVLFAVIRYGVLLPGKEGIEVKAKLDEEEIERLVQKITDAIQKKKKKKKFWEWLMSLRS